MSHQKDRPDPRSGKSRDGHGPVFLNYQGYRQKNRREHDRSAEVRNQPFKPVPDVAKAIMGVTVREKLDRSPGNCVVDHPCSIQDYHREQENRGVFPPFFTTIKNDRAGHDRAAGEFGQARQSSEQPCYERIGGLPGPEGEIKCGHAEIGERQIEHDILSIDKDNRADHEKQRRFVPPAGSQQAAQGKKQERRSRIERKHCPVQHQFVFPK